MLCAQLHPQGAVPVTVAEQGSSSSSVEVPAEGGAAAPTGPREGGPQAGGPQAGGAQAHEAPQQPAPGAADELRQRRLAHFEGAGP